MGSAVGLVLQTVLFAVMEWTSSAQNIACPQTNGSLVGLKKCNGALTCPATSAGLGFFMVPGTSVNAACQLTVTASNGVHFTMSDIMNITSSAACGSWVNVFSAAGSTASAAQEACSKARYRLDEFFFPGTAVATFMTGHSEEPSLIYAEDTYFNLCQPSVVNITTATTFAVTPLNYSGDSCRTQLVGPPGYVLRMTLRAVEPRIASGQASNCVCYLAAEGDSTDASKCFNKGSTVTFAEGAVTIVVSSDDSGVRCAAVLLMEAVVPGLSRGADSMQAASSLLWFTVLGTTYFRL